MPEASEQLITVNAAPLAKLPLDGGAVATPKNGELVDADSAAAVKKKRVQMAIVGALLLVIVLIITDQVTKTCTYQPSAASTTVPVSPEPTPCYQAALRNFIAWVRDNPSLGVLAVIIVYAFATVLFIPGAIITLSVGAAFARALGTPVRVMRCVLIVPAATMSAFELAH